MPRSLNLELPRCPDHKKGQVTRAGTYGSQQWPLYRCHVPSGKTHAFTVLAPDRVQRFHYPASEIAHALVLLGRGAGFYQAALEARDRAGRPKSKDTNLTVYWLERFGPAILRSLLPQPTKIGVLLLDAQPFNVAALDDEGYPKEGGRMVFTVMAAAGQARRGAPLEVLRLIGSRSKDAPTWRSFLKQVPGTPERIICDGERAISSSARVRWPAATLYLSEWQTLHRADEILAAAGLHSRKGQLYPALRHAFDSATAWRRFTKLARAERNADLEKWIIDVEAIGPPPRFVRREHPRTTGALETMLRTIKKDLAVARAAYKDVPRLNLVLGLMTLRANHTDRERDYAEIIRRTS